MIKPAKNVIPGDKIKVAKKFVAVTKIERCSDPHNIHIDSACYFGDTLVITKD